MNATISLTIIAALRFFGLFVVLPTIGLYADAFQTSAFLAGLAAGGYAMTQVVFQTPFGILSDRFDKKLIIAIGLVIFILGSLVCAMSQSIEMLIFGRFLQGAGAIGGVVSAQIAELVREERRAKAMAIMGSGIFFSFILAMILGPIIANISLSYIFYLTAILSSISLILLFIKVPKTPKITYTYTSTHSFKTIFNNNLLLMYLSALLQKSLMLMSFVVISLSLIRNFSIDSDALWHFYAPAGVIGLVAMVPCMIFAQKKGKFKEMMILGILAFIVAYFCMALSVYSGILPFFVVGIFVFFIGFSIHEPLMQTLASMYPKASQKGSALGIFTTFGYIGSALGGMAGGYMLDSVGLFTLSIIVCAICIVWALLMSIYLANPINQKNIYIKLDSHPQLDNLASKHGIIESYINTQENLAIIKYNNKEISQEQILQMLNIKDNS